MHNLRQLRKSTGLTMKELGKKVGMSESTISLYETGKHQPDMETMGRLADVLGVSIDEIMGRAPPQPKKEPANDSGPPDDFKRRIELLTPQSKAILSAYLDGLLDNQSSSAP